MNKTLKTILIISGVGIAGFIVYNLFIKKKTEEIPTQVIPKKEIKEIPAQVIPKKEKRKGAFIPPRPSVPVEPAPPTTQPTPEPVPTPEPTPTPTPPPTPELKPPTEKPERGPMEKPIYGSEPIVGMEYIIKPFGTEPQFRNVMVIVNRESNLLFYYDYGNTKASRIKFTQYGRHAQNKEAISYVGGKAVNTFWNPDTDRFICKEKKLIETADAFHWFGKFDIPQRGFRNLWLRMSDVRLSSPDAPLVK